MNKTELLKRFGKNVKIERIKKDMTQEQLAEKLEVSRTYLASVECGNENMSLGKILEVAQVLNINIEKLLKFADDQISSG